VFRPGDPYAGYLVAGKGGSVTEGTVRDVHLEQWEQQLASLKGQGAQVVAILARGRGKAEFGDFPTFEYVRDVLEKSGQAELVKLADSEKYSVVLSGHSGGGSTKVIPMLGRGEADTADRGSLKPQLPPKTETRVVNKLQPVDLVVLYEALNGDYDVLGVIEWVRAQLKRLVLQLDKDKARALAATPVLRGYYGQRKASSYTDPYRWLACVINEEIKSRVPEAHRDDVSDHFRIIEVAPRRTQPRALRSSTRRSPAARSPTLCSPRVTPRGTARGRWCPAPRSARGSSRTPGTARRPERPPRRPSSKPADR
jgi:hypothetical protein